MLVAATQRRSIVAGRGPLDALESAYVEYFHRFGLHLAPIPNHLDGLNAYLDHMKIQGVVLTGGGDVHPSLYGGDRARPGEYSPQRDEVERRLLEMAVLAGMPVFGICRGMQSINVHLGGSLTQGIGERLGVAEAHGRSRHDVTLCERSIAAKLGTDSVEVNSYHNHGLTARQLAPGFVPFAVATDRTVEGMCDPARGITAVMWHPERPDAPERLDELLIAAFVARSLG